MTKLEWELVAALREVERLGSVVGRDAITKVAREAIAQANTGSHRKAVRSEVRPMDAIAILRDAADRAETALALLNTNTTLCTCCGLNKAENWDEKQVSEQVAASVQKLRKLAGQLERKRS